MVRSDGCFTVEITSEVNCFEVPDQQWGLPASEKTELVRRRASGRLSMLTVLEVVEVQQEVRIPPAFQHC